MQLRGGGCTGSKKQTEVHKFEQKRNQQKVADITNDNNEKSKLARYIKQHSETIINYAITAASEKQKLMVSFSFFHDNERELWQVVMSSEQTNEIFDIAKKQLKPLMEALEILIKSFVNYSVYVAQIISQLSWIIFSFYTIKKTNRYMDVEEQSEYLKAVSKIEEQMKIEKNIDKYLNNLEYELFIISSILTICPTNSKELQEIMELFVSGVIKSFMTFSISGDLLQSLMRGAVYLYGEQNKASCKKKLAIILTLLNMKFTVIQMIEDIGEKEKKHPENYLEQLNNIYKNVISKSSDWQIWCTWIKITSSLFQQKLILPGSMVEKYCKEQQTFLQQLPEKKVWVNIDSKLIENNASAKLLFQNIEQLQEQAKLQYAILQGYDDMPSFESLYFTKLAKENKKKDSKEYDFILTSISLMLHYSETITKSQEKVCQLVNVLNPNNSKAIKEIETNLQIAISCTVALLEEILTFDKLKSHIFQVRQESSNVKISPQEQPQKSAQPDNNQDEIQEQVQQEQKKHKNNQLFVSAPIGQQALKQQDIVQKSPMMKPKQNQLLMQTQQLNIGEKKVDKNQKMKWFQPHIKIKRQFCSSFIQLHLKREMMKLSNSSSVIIYDIANEFIIKQYQRVENEVQQNQILASNQNLVDDSNLNQQVVAAASPRISNGNNSPAQNIQQQFNFNVSDAVNEEDSDTKFDVIKELYSLNDFKTHQSNKHKKQNFKKYYNVVEDFSKKPNEIDEIVSLQTKLKLIKILKSKHTMETNEDYKQALKESFEQLSFGFAFLKWNLRLYLTMKFYTQQFNDLQTQISSVNHLKVLSLQLAELKPLTKTIKFFYEIVDACSKLKIFKDITPQSKIQKILQTITLRKFTTANILAKIYKEILNKSIENFHFSIAQKIFISIQEETEKIVDHLSHLQSGFQMAKSLIQQEALKQHDGNDVFNELQMKSSFEYEFILPENDIQRRQNKQNHQKIEEYYKRFTKWVQQLEKKLKQQQNLKEQLEQKDQSIKKLLKTLEMIQQYQVISEDDTQIWAMLHNDANKQMKAITEIALDFPQADQNLNQLEDGEIFFKRLYSEIEGIEQMFKTQLNNVQFINDENGLFATLLKNYLMLEKISSEQSVYQEKFEKTKLQLEKLLNSYEKTIPEELVNCCKIQNLLKSNLCNFPKDLESSVFFILTQIEKQTENSQETGFFDQFKEASEDLFTSQSWRIRQSCIFELIQLRGSCLTANSVTLSTGLYIKFQIYETDKRNKLLLGDHDAEVFNEAVHQYWPSQEEEVQNKIKNKLEELNDIAYKITIEITQHEKAKLKKEYIKLEQEIQTIIKNAEGLGNSIGTSLLFFQDLKQDLVTIQSQLKTLQSSIDQISKDVQYLRGRSYKDLLEMRMQRILQSRLIINSESVYIQIKTKEKKIGTETEDEETPLFTEDIFSNGEINEFIWQEQKISLLIQGKAGSGKSTAARKIEEFLWLLYQKNKDIQGSIPIIPIFVTLPQLKDPLYSAMEETLRSDNYRFNDKQILELKEAVEQNELKLVIIMDSYDEIKSQFIGVNLNQTNKIFKWRAQSDEMKFPKIITTSRSEIFNSGGYNSWFLSESDNLALYKEVRLLNFSPDQVKLYIEQYCILCVKKVVKEFYFSQKENQGFFAFQELFNDIIKVITESQNISPNKLLLSEEQIQKIIQRCQTFVTGDIAMAMQEMLQDIWSERKYQDFINKMEIDSLLETPFMVEIVVTVLPLMVKHRQEVGFLKEQFVDRYKHLNKIEQDGQKVVLDLWQKIINNEGFISDFIHQFSQIQQIQVMEQHLRKLQDFEMIKRCLLVEPLCAFDFYMQFFEQYFKRQINKLKEAGQAIDYQSIGGELWEFAHKLANDMTIQNLSQVKFKPSGLIFKKRESDWTDIYFNDDCESGAFKKIFRSIIPIKQKFGVYSFNHKSLQEFLVSKWFIELLQGFNSDPEQYLAKNLQIFDESFFSISWDQDFMKGSVKFVADKLKNNTEAIEKLKSILKLSSSDLETLKKIKSEEETKEKLDKLDQKICRGSSNSLYLLHQMGVSFIGQNFQRLKIKDINLSGANFYNSDLSHSNFQNVKISKINFNLANLSYIDWTQIQIDELPHIPTPGMRINYITYLNKQKILLARASELKKGSPEKIYFYDFFQVSGKGFEVPGKGFEMPFTPTLLIQSNNDILVLIQNDNELAISINKDMEFLHKKIVSKQEKNGNFKFGVFLQDDEYLFLAKDKTLYQISILKLQERAESCQFDDDIAIVFETPILGLKMTDHYKIFVLLKRSCEYFIFDQETQRLESRTSINQIQETKLFEVSYSSNHLAIADKQSKGQDIKLFNLKKPEEQPIDFHVTNELFSYLQFVQEEKYLLTVSNSADDSQVTYLRLWHVSEHIQIQQILILDKVVSVSFVPDPFLIITALQNFTISIWDLMSSFTQNFVKVSSIITCCAFTTSGNHLISGNNNGLIQVWDTSNGKRFGKNLNNHKKNITSLAIVWENEKELLGSASLDGYVCVWNLQQQKLMYSVYVINPIRTLNFTNNNEIVTLSEESNYLQIWQKDRKSYLLVGDDGYQQHIQIYLDNTKAVIEECGTNEFELLTENLFFKIEPQQNNFNQIKITAMLVNEHFQYLILATNEGAIGLVKENQPNFSVFLDGPYDDSNKEIIILRETSKDGFIAASKTKIRMYSLIRSENKVRIQERKQYFSNLVFNDISYISCDQDGMFVCHGQIQQYSLKTGLLIRNVCNYNQDVTTCLFYYREKNKLFIGCESGTLRTLDLLTNQSDLCEAHVYAIKAIDLLKIQKKILTGSSKGEIKLWSLTSTDSNMICFKTIETGSSISQLWISNTEDILVIQSDCNVLIQMLSEKVQYQVASISKYQQVALCLKQQYVYYTDDNKIQKQSILQQKLKELFMNNSSYKPDIMVMGNQEIITSDNYCKIYFWDYSGNLIQKFENIQQQMQKFTLSISDAKDKLLIFYEDQNYGLLSFFLQSDQTSNKMIKCLDIDLTETNQELSTPNDANFLDEENILLTQKSFIMEAFVFSIKENKVIQGFHDHENPLYGQAVFKNQYFVTYGENNQISFYEKVGNKFAEKFVLSETVQKFNIRDANLKDSKVISKYGVDLNQLFQQKNKKVL